MVRVFSSETGVGVYVFADDHCPPHVHARHRGEGWVARIGFSYAERAVRLISIAPLKNAPLKRILNEVLADVGGQLEPCRWAWWTIRQTTCLTNRWVKLRAGGGIEWLAAPTASARQVEKADYYVASGRVGITFWDGAGFNMETRV